VSRQASALISRIDPTADDAGVVDHAVEPAERLHRTLHRRGHIGFRADVGADEDRPAQLRGQPLARLGLHVGDQDSRALGGEQARGGRPDPTRPAGDHRDLLFETTRHPEPGYFAPVVIFHGPPGAGAMASTDRSLCRKAKLSRPLSPVAGPRLTGLQPCTMV
jgi:hypothetical protein